MKQILVNKLFFTILTFLVTLVGLAVGQYLLLRSHINVAISLLNSHLGAQGVIVGVRGPMSLFSKLLENLNSLFLEAIEFQQGARVVLSQKYEVPSDHSLAEAMGISIPFRGQVGDYLLHGRVVPPNLTFVLLLLGAFCLAALSYFLICFLDWRYQLRLVEEMSVKRTEIAEQVAHDIRSPISAINMLLASIPEVPEEKRNVLRGAAQRINDIANGLLKPGSLEVAKVCNDNETKVQARDGRDLLPVLEQVLAEKELQFQALSSVRIKGDLDQARNVHVVIDMACLSRIVSNLINNSVEALPGEGKVTLSVRTTKDRVTIIVNDNGKGIPDDVLAKLGNRGVSFEKDMAGSGSGLGLYHAKKEIEEVGGSLILQSKVGIGTMVSINLPSLID